MEIKKLEIQKQLTIVVATGNTQLAFRDSDHTAFMLAGEDMVGGLMEYGTKDQSFTNARDEQTEG